MTTEKTGLLENIVEPQAKKAGKKRLTEEEKAEKAEQKRLADAEKKRLADIAKAEKQRLNDEKKAEKKRLGDIKKAKGAENKRLADAEKKRLTEENKKRQAEEKAAQKKRLDEEKKKTQERLVVKALESQIPGKSFSLKALAENVPVPKADFVAVINQLLAAERLQVTEIDAKFGIVGVKLVSDGAKPVVTPPPVASPQSSGPNDYDLFRAAVGRLGYGRPYSSIRICDMRNTLGWDTERFNDMLRKLRKEGTIQLLGGDPSDFTIEERRQFFTDDRGSSYATLTWIKQ